jgi:DNA-binding response OmpR family regulator
MPRPRTILWVDDEIETLDSQVLFLEQHGFTVERAANGDDALALLRRQPYGIVLLDEQIPGRRGLDLVPDLRAMDTAMPVVMVTKSEEPEILREAIGVEVSDYLTKPVSPRQVLSVVTKLLEGDRIRSQRLSRDFTQRFRELEGRRSADLAWREWVELVAELADWEVKLGQADEPGLQEALRTLQSSVRMDFARFLAANYPGWVADRSADRPPLSVDVVSEFVRPVLDHRGRVMLVVVDCLRLDQWAMLRPLVERLFDIEVDHYFSILPTATPYSRNAIFSGLYPREMVARHPQWWNEQEETSLNAHEDALLRDQLRALTGRDVAVQYEKVFSALDGEAMLKRLPAHLAHDGVTALVFNFIDQLTHGRTENEALFEVARDAPALRSLTRTWFERSALFEALKEAERRRVSVILTTDHGSIHCHTPATIHARRDATANLRFKFGDELRVDDPAAAVVVDDLPAWGLPPRGPTARLLLATDDRFFVYPTKLREYQSRYRGAFLHGGVSPEEVVLPVALLTPRRG